MHATDNALRYEPEPHVHPEISQFINDFFAVSDTPGEHDRYVDQFQEDATFILGSRHSVGSDGRLPNAPNKSPQASLTAEKKLEKLGRACGRMCSLDDIVSTKYSLHHLQTLKSCSTAL